MTDSQYGIPLLVNGFADSPAVGLNRIRLGKDANETYDERWLQRLVSRYPNLLPIEQLEPALTPAISICMELPLRSGFADNLFATPNGDLIVGETKLFRNPEARREVVGQIIDYAKDLSAMSYETLNEAIHKAASPNGQAGQHATDLYQTVMSAGARDVRPEQFIDAVSRNLERGRFLLLVIGDGIQSGTEGIAAFLQQHAGMHFTLGVVELAVFRLPERDDSYLVQPRVLARTRNIERGIVTFCDGRISVAPSKVATAGGGEAPKYETISEDRYYEKLESHLPGITSRLTAFVQRLERIGIAAEFGSASLILRWYLDDVRAWNMGAILTNGKVWTEGVNTNANAVGLLRLSQAYIGELAKLIPGATVKKPPKPTSWYVQKNGTYIKIDELLAHEDDWIALMEKFMAGVRESLSDQ